MLFRRNNKKDYFGRFSGDVNYFVECQIVFRKINNGKRSRGVDYGGMRYDKLRSTTELSLLVYWLAKIESGLVNHNFRIIASSRPLEGC